RSTPSGNFSEGGRKRSWPRYARDVFSRTANRNRDVLRSPRKKRTCNRTVILKWHRDRHYFSVVRFITHVLYAKCQGADASQRFLGRKGVHVRTVYRKGASSSVLCAV